jgi:hypothetical protein
MREKRKAYRLCVRKPDTERPRARPRCRWVNNITMYLREIEWDGMDWVATYKKIHRIAQYFLL